ncbi:multiple C2 and transmembrane domain-containing protein 2 isoform X3 [Gymnodraco acuticeps]|uniref:Multiple C2 and transmembrane domain-containing protein 2 isoform X3 n=1 Tax=Gymnodraco acuticeps TaxID=8218 RepID=A0A6P8VGI3_GYMAC|nr:multiple C2 and transmembrane domain-containing protein 2 isoform X3 [Gymnodraco acuticeps]
MEVKKKNFLGNLRLKTKLVNLKKPGRKKLGRKLAHRRSISVPDLRFVPDESFPADNPDGSTPSDAIFFGHSPGQSDSDSVASGSIVDGQHITDKPYDTVSENQLLRVPRERTAAALKRISAPSGSQSLYDEIDQMSYTGSEIKLNIAREGLYAKVNKGAKGNAPKFPFDPILRPKSPFPKALSPRPDLVERESVSGEDATADRWSSSAVAAVLARASSMGDQINPYRDKRPASVEYKKSSSEKGTPLQTRVARADTMSPMLDTLGTPLERSDGTSQGSTCGSPNDEQGNMPWTTDSEDLDRELCSPFLMGDFTNEEILLEEIRKEEALEETAEMSSETCDLFDENMQDILESSSVVTGETDIQGPLPCQRYLLSINLKQGRNLVARAKRSGTSDPYVKFKLEGKQFCKSKVVYKSLNPRWNETFFHALRDREHDVEVRVFDKNRTADEFMGSSTISLKSLELYKTYEMELRLDDPKSKEDDMGVIIVDICLMFRDATIKRSPRWPPRKNKQNPAPPTQRPSETQRNPLNNQKWTGVLRVTLVEGLDLPQYGDGDIYVRFRLGDQKYKSKNICVQANPQWREQFDFNQFEDNQEPLQVEVYSKRGRKGEESWGMFEIALSRLPLNERQLYTHVLDPGKGRLVFLVTLRPCWGVSISDIETATLESPDERDTVEKKLSLKNTHKCVGEVGFLQVKVIKANDLPATDLNGKSNPFCVVELGNSKLQTHTFYKTVNPEWNKALTFPIKDIHDVIELTLLDENGDKAPNFLGKVDIPLLTVQNGQQICLLLKKEDLGSASKGTITLVLDVIYNKVRAGIRTFKPKETKLMEENQKFSKKVLARNIYRVRNISTAVLYTLQYIKSCFQWESTQRSLIAFLNTGNMTSYLSASQLNSSGVRGASLSNCLMGAEVTTHDIFLVTVWHWELFMLPLFLLLLIGWHYFQLSAGKASSNQDLVNMSMGDEEEEDEKFQESGKKGLMDKIHMVQEVVLVVQNVLEEIANIGERIKNIFNWSVPFLSCMAFLMLFVTTALLYYIPLRYIVLIWGVNKFTKRLRNPHTIDNNEILDFLKRVPSDVQKVQHSAIRAPTSQNQPRKKR